MAPPDEPELTAERMAEIAALADGTLAPGRRADVEALTGQSPALGAELARQRRVVEVLHEARRRDRAPDRLRATLTTAQPRRNPPARARLRYGGLVAATMAAAAVVIAMLLSNGGPAAPTLSEAAVLATRGPSAPAPPPDPQAPRARLTRAVQELYFPNWATTLGWRATGQRSDRLSGHDAITVYYGWSGRQVAYTILTSPPLPEPSGRVIDDGGLRLRALVLGGRQVVTWRRGGHTCIVSARGVPAQTLARLAAWPQPSTT